MLLSLDGVNILFSLPLGSGLLGRVIIGTDGRVIVLEQGILESINRLSIFVLRSEGVGFASQSFAMLEGVVVLSRGLGHSDVALLNAFIEFFHFEVDSSQVGVESKL